MTLSLCFYQPDIPQNMGGIMRLAACMGVRLHIVEPCGFIFDDKRMKRSGMDYIGQVDMMRHASWNAFFEWRGAKRLVLMTTKSSTPLQNFHFQPEDIIVMGRESAGVPEEVAAACDARIRIPMQEGARSLNVVVSAGIALWEGLRQA